MVIAIVGCNKKDPTPELRDPLIQELENRKKVVEQELVSAKEALTEAEANMSKVVPQTGQIKYATKRVNQARSRITKAQQQIQFLEIKIEAQKYRAREEYLKAYYAKKDWPSDEDREDFRLMVKAYEMERNWSAKDRREALGFKNGRQPATADAPAAPAPSGGH